MENILYEILKEARVEAEALIAAKIAERLPSFTMPQITANLSVYNVPKELVPVDSRQVYSDAGGQKTGWLMFQPSFEHVCICSVHDEYEYVIKKKTIAADVIGGDEIN